MSLSRYYKNTPSFQAEDLVKQIDKTAPGWVADPRKEQQPFRTQQTVTQPRSDGSHLTGNTPSAREKPASPQTIAQKNVNDSHSAATSSPAEIKAAAPDEKSIDLNRYILRTEAEKKTSEAYRRGQEEGRTKAEEDFGATARALALACQQLDTLRSTIIANSSQEMLTFSLAIAERILRLSLREQDHTIIATIEEALRRAVKSDEFTIHIHPDDYDTLAEKSAQIVAGLSGLNNIVIRKDPTIERGGARIESDNCTIDATIAGQLEAIREEVKKSL